MLRRAATRLLALPVALVLASVPPASAAQEATTGSDRTTARAVTVRLLEAVKRLRVAKERRVGYDRDKFDHWVDADGDCLDTRAEVLQRETRSGWTASACTIVRGKWYSYYDGETWRRASNLDIDHLVPLAEAWDSGARRWNANTRQRFANDLGDRRTLVAVTDNVNQSKGDQDIAEWLAQRGGCRYTVEWVAVKTRWRLSVNRAEKRLLRELARECGNPRLRVDRARIGTESGGGGGGGDQPVGRMRIAKVVYDPPGTDTENAETITLVNRGKRAHLQGFRLRDEAGATYRLPRYRIGHGGRVTIHSGDGRDRRRHLYADWGFTWNNTGDTARLLKPGGGRADTCSWGDGSGTTYC